MRIFVYEFVTGGGWWSMSGDPPGGSLLIEGRAMAEAVADDFRQLGAEVVRIIDSRLTDDNGRAAQRIASPSQEREVFTRLAAAADWTLVIAPESGGMLLERSRWVSAAGGLLSPSPATVELTGNKQRTAEHLARHGIRVPNGVELHSAADAPLNLFPAVLKPLDGCGSQGVRRIDNPRQLRDLSIDRPQRLERFVPGLAASVAVLCGPGLLVPLPACEQRLSDDGRFTYLGGRTPLAEPQGRRTRDLATAAVTTLPDPLGYLGVDLVLGEASDGSGDYVIEINPRLTTSYVGLRQLCRENLAAAMLETARGRRPALSWHPREVQFSADGQVLSRSVAPHKQGPLREIAP
jgi:predicted ATP-grasp superfamily ATP-dependent carboligase